MPRLFETCAVLAFAAAIATSAVYARERDSPAPRVSLAVAIFLIGLLAAAGVSAQTQAPAPTITAVAVGEEALTVAWSAPDGVSESDITAYDVRHIESDAPDKDDANWTLKEDAWLGYELRAFLFGLTDGQSYDVQVRAVALSSSGDGAWSATVTGTPTDGGGNRASAIPVTLQVPAVAGFSSGDTSDYFEIELSAASSTLLFFTNSLVADTVGELQSADGAPLDSNDDAFLQLFSGRQGELLGYEGFGLNFFMAQRDLAKGTYYLKVEPFDVHYGSSLTRYALYVRSITDAGDSPATAKRTVLDLPVTGRLDSATDTDYFRFTLDRETAVRLYAAAVPIQESLESNVIVSNEIDVEAEIVDGDGDPVDGVVHTTGHATHVEDGHPHYGFSSRATLPAGTHYVRIASSAGDTGGYLFQAYADTGPFEDTGPLVDLTTDFDPCPSGTQDDPLYGCQWHLNNTGQYQGGARQDINVESVWSGGNKGEGANVAVVDGGMYWLHDDLIDNVVMESNHNYFDTSSGAYQVPHDINHLVLGPDYPAVTDYEAPWHGTGVAGLIAARDNGIGVRGVAPRANIYGYNLIFSTNFSAANEADSMSRNAENTMVSNNSWGYPDNGWPRTPRQSWTIAVTAGIGSGNGVSYVWAGGNGHWLGDDANLDGRANFHAVLAVCAVGDHDRRTGSSERGANLWVCGPSHGGRRSLTTTDLDHKYTETFGGTSGSAPIVSGVLALLRSANTGLTWRDARLILAASARKNDSGNSGWRAGALRYGSTSERYHFNHQYGFGMVDAAAAEALADGWTSVPRYRHQAAQSADVDLAIPDRPAGGAPEPVVSTLVIGNEVEFVEFVEVNTDFDHSAFRNLEIELESPSGAISKLLTHDERDPNDDYEPQGEFVGSHRFGSARHLGENPAGTWMLSISDAIGESDGRNGGGTLKAWNLKVYGHRYAPDAPDIETVTGGDNELTVTWNAPSDTGVSDIVAYDLRHILSEAPDKADAHWTVLDNAWSSGDLEGDITDLLNGIGYDVQARAVNGNGDGLWSVTATGTTNPGPPAQVTGVKLERRAAALLVSWDEVPNATGYRVQWKSGTEKWEDAAADNREASVSGRSTTRYRIGDLDPAVTYDVRVVSTSAQGAGTESGSVGAQPAALAQVSIAAGKTPVFEAAGAVAAFTLTRDSVLTESLTVDIEVAETGRMIDGTPASTVTFAAGAATATLEVALDDDSVLEFDGSNLTATVATGSGYTVSSTAASAMVRALDDDARFQVRFDNDGIRVNENAVSASIGVTARAAVGAPAPSVGTGGIAVTATQRDALRPEDYGAFGATVVGGAIEFAASDFGSVSQGQRLARKTLTVAIVNDRIDEDDESFDVELRVPATQVDPSVVVFGTNNHPTVTETEVTVADDDAEPSLAVNVDRSSIAENGGSATITVTTGSGSTFETVQIVTLTADGTATEHTDFTIGGKRLTLPAGENANASFVSTTVEAVDDRIHEGGETILISGARGGDGFGTQRRITIADDDTESTVVTLTADPASVREDASDTVVTVKAALNEAAFPADTDVDVDVGRGSDSAVEGADYATVEAFTLTIGAGATDGAATFTLNPAEDGTAEGDETIGIAGSAAGLRVDTASLSLNDIDTPSTGLALTLSPSEVGEGGGARTVSVKATLDGGARTTDTPVTIEVGQSGDTAVEGTDYATVDDFTLTVDEGETSGEAAFTLRPTSDVTAEGDETITVDGDTGDLTVTAATLTLADDDAVSSAATLTLSPLVVGEGTVQVSVTVRAELDAGARTTDTNLTLSIGGNADTAVAGADYERVSGQRLVIAANETIGETSFPFRPTDDGTAEGVEEITVSGSASGLWIPDAMLRLADNDVASLVLTLAASPFSVQEDASRTRITVSATLDASARETATEVRLRVGAAGDTAVAGSHYERVQDFTLTVPANETRGEADFQLEPKNDETAGGGRTLSVIATAPVSGLRVEPAGGAQIDIADDDLPAILLVPESLTIVESETDTYTVALQTAPSADVTVAITGSGDVSVDPASLEFTGNDWSIPQSVTVRVADDPDVVRDPDVRLVHVAAGAMEYADLRGEVVVSIGENDEALVFSRKSLTVPEGGSAIYAVALAQQLTGVVEVTVTDEPGDDLSLDRTSIEFQTGDWDVPQTITVSAAEDNDTASDPPVTLTHRAFGGGLDGVEADVRVTISENDSPPPPPGGGGAANRPPVIESAIEPQTLEVREVLELDIRRNFYDRERRVTYLAESANPWVATVTVDQNGVLTLTGISRGATAVTVTVVDHREERVSQTFAVTVRGPVLLPLFPSASDPLGRQGFVRVINRSAEAGQVSIEADDDSDTDYGAVTLAIGGGETVHFNSDDLEQGNVSKGLSGSTGTGTGDWRLTLSSELDVEALAYVRTADGFLTAMHDVAAVRDGQLWVATFNPGSNPNQASRLRLVNPGDADAQVTISGVDDSGASPGTAVVLTVPAGVSRTLTAAALESGGDGLEGALGDGAGKWRLRLKSETRIVVMSLLTSPTGHLTNLSTARELGGSSEAKGDYIPE